MLKVSKLILLFCLLFIPVTAFSAPVEVNEIGPFDLAPQRKAYHYAFSVQNPEGQQYFLELVNGDGKDLELYQCKNKPWFLRFFCHLKNRYLVYRYKNR